MKLGTTEAIIGELSLLEDFPFLLEELLSEVELELFDFPELEDLAELELVVLLLEEADFSELEDFAELELVGFVVSLLEEVSSLLDDDSFSALEDDCFSSLEDDSFSTLEDEDSTAEELLLASELELAASELELVALLEEDSSAEEELATLLEEAMFSELDEATDELLCPLAMTSIVALALALLSTPVTESTTSYCPLALSSTNPTIVAVLPFFLSS